MILVVVVHSVLLLVTMPLFKTPCLAIYMKRRDQPRKSILKIENQICQLAKLFIEDSDAITVVMDKCDWSICG